MKLNFYDKVVSYFNPEKAFKQAYFRELLGKNILNFGYSEHGANQTKKSMRGYDVTNGTSPDDDITENIDTLRGRSRDLFMGGSNLATGAIKTIRTNVIGAGLKMNAQIDAKFLNLTDEEASNWEENTEREWLIWANSKLCDASRVCNFFQLQGLVLMSALLSGDVFALLPLGKDPNMPYDLRIQLIEADRVCNPKVYDPELDLLEGVEVGKYGEAVAFWVSKYHPYTFIQHNKPVINTWTRIPAYGARTGRPNILQIFGDVERPCQRRGVPILSPVIEAMKQLGRYTEAELVAAVVSGMFTVFIKSNTPEQPLGEMIGVEIDGNPKIAGDDKSAYELGNGAIVGLGANESIETANPTRPNAAFDSFVIAICRQIGAALEVPYELLVKNFTASYSASRAALLEAWKMFKMKREWLISNFCRPVYEEWLAEAVAKGRIKAKGFFKDAAIRAAWSGAEWYGASQGQIDPEKEARAAQLRVQEGFSTRERESTELTGMSFEKIQNVRNREEIKRAESEAKVAEIEKEQDLKYRREIMEMQAEIQSKYSQGKSLGGFFNMPDNNRAKSSQDGNEKDSEKETESENENESENESENANKEENTNA